MSEMSSTAVPPVGRAETSVLVLLALFVGAPALAVMVGFANGKAVFFLYREPKLVAMMILGWVFLAAAAWGVGGRLGWRELRSVFRLLPMPWMAVFVAYSWLTLAWSIVPENSMYELQQYSLLFMVLVALLMWGQITGSIRKVVAWSMMLSLAGLVIIGILQGWGLLGFIEPIDPSDLVSYPSLMGYKNPMAMATLGQLFLLAGVFMTTVSKKRWRTAAFLAFVLATELIFLILLQSRTALLGLAAGLVWGFVLSLARLGTRRAIALGLAGILAVVFAVAIVAALNPKVDRKVRSAVGFAVRPESFFDSDRGTYLVNTLNMVRHNPFGVGVGDWQTHYPLYRVKNRYLWFDEEFQVRRAHSDHVQLLGELGWPGFSLWVGFLVSVVWLSVRRWRQARRPFDLFLSAQLVAVIAAMGTDYVIEHPYGKFQFFLLVFLCISARDVVPHARPSRVTGRGLRVGVAILCTAVALLNGLYFAQLAGKTLAAAHMTRSYLRALPSQVIPDKKKQRVTGPDRPEKLFEALAHARTFNNLPGQTKTMFRDYLLMADTLRKLGYDSQAEASLLHSLALHPYHPASLRLMSLLKDDPDESKQWIIAHDYVMDVATCGFDMAYPPDHPLDHLHD